MADDKVLKGVFKDGAVVASVVQKEGSARILAKGVEPDAPALLDELRKIAEGCKAHTEGFADRELCLVAVASPAAAEGIRLDEAALASLQITRLTVMDGACGVLVRSIDAEPAPIPLAYGSLRASSGLPNQPGAVEVPAAHPRRSHAALDANQKKVYEAAAQVAGRGLLGLVCFEDGELQLAVTVKDFPPPRARSVLVPIGRLARDLEGALTFDGLVQALAPLRA
jgi:hypothetical protein